MEKNYKVMSKNIHIDDFTKILFEEFVLGTPAFDMSEKGRSFYEYYKYKKIDDFYKIKCDLIGNIEFNHMETINELNEKFKDSKYDT